MQEHLSSRTRLWRLAERIHRIYQEPKSEDDPNPMVLVIALVEQELKNALAYADQCRSAANRTQAAALEAVQLLQKVREYTARKAVELGAHEESEEVESDRRLTRNVAECPECGDVIESKHVHDYVACVCGKIATDGGLEYVRRMGPAIDRSEYSE